MEMPDTEITRVSSVSPQRDKAAMTYSPGTLAELRTGSRVLIWVSAQKTVAYFHLYGLNRGLLLLFFGSDAVWRMQLQVLRTQDDNTALAFKQTSKEESGMVAVASSILAQIAITSLSLDNINDIHWTPRGFFIFSLVTAIMSVYYASRQYRILGRCLTAEDVRSWITNGKPDCPTALPTAASVLTVSAPGALLSASVHAFLVGFGVYLGFLWTQALGDSSVILSGNEKAIFLTYIVTLGVSYTLYTFSSFLAGEKADPTDLYLEDLRRLWS